MDSFFKYYKLLFFLAFLYACEDPAPIELLNTAEEVEINIINPEPNSFVFTGYDSTGITNALPVNKSLISLSGIKNTINGKSYYRGYGEAVFFDTTKPIFNSMNKLIGFNTINFGKVKFGNDTARVIPYFLKYRENYVTKDTAIGFKHIIKYDRVITSDLFNFPFNKNLNIQFVDQIGNASLMTIRLPDQINGNLIVEGSKEEKNLKISVKWNKSFINPNNISGEISEEIIVGGISENELIPLFKLSKFRENQFDLPNALLKQVLDSGEYNYLVFSFIRKIRKLSSTSRLGDIYFASQSIHNIWINI